MCYITEYERRTIRPITAYWDLRYRIWHPTSSYYCGTIIIVFLGYSKKVLEYYIKLEYAAKIHKHLNSLFCNIP
jgi:hypothetical protein